MKCNWKNRYLPGNLDWSVSVYQYWFLLFLFATDNVANKGQFVVEEFVNGQQTMMHC